MIFCLMVANTGACRGMIYYIVFSPIMAATPDSHTQSKFLIHFWTENWGRRFTNTWVLFQYLVLWILAAVLEYYYYNYAAPVNNTLTSYLTCRLPLSCLYHDLHLEVFFCIFHKIPNGRWYPGLAIYNNRGLIAKKLYTGCLLNIVFFPKI